VKTYITEMVFGIEHRCVALLGESAAKYFLWRRQAQQIEQSFE